MQRTPSTGDRARKVQATFNLPGDLLEECRDTVVALAGPPHHLTLAALVENALRRELRRLRGERSGQLRGQAFPDRARSVRQGRPIGRSAAIHDEQPTASRGAAPEDRGGNSV